MATEFIMPKLGLTMEEGTITEWFADDGDTVEAGAALLRIETDKTETDVEAAASGRLHRVGQVGDTFACGELIGWFLADGEQAPAPSAPVAPAVAATAPVAADAGCGRARRRRHDGTRHRVTDGEADRCRTQPRPAPDPWHRPRRPHRGRGSRGRHRHRRSARRRSSRARCRSWLPAPVFRRPRPLDSWPTCWASTSPRFRPISSSSA